VVSVLVTTGYEANKRFLILLSSVLLVGKMKMRKARTASLPRNWKPSPQAALVSPMGSGDQKPPSNAGTAVPSVGKSDDECPDVQLQVANDGDDHKRAAVDSNVDVATPMGTPATSTPDDDDASVSMVKSLMNRRATFQ
jgi:hypothetical protein